jgi:sRNA-binding protein
MTHERARLAHLRDLAKVLNVDLVDLPPVFLNPMPLQIGTYRALRARYPGAKAKPLGRWLAHWCRSRTYLEMIVAGAVRYDVEGQPAGEITELERAHAQAQLAAFPPKRAKSARAIASGCPHTAEADRPPTHVPPSTTSTTSSASVRTGRPILRLPSLRGTP